MIDTPSGAHGLQHRGSMLGGGGGGGGNVTVLALLCIPQPFGTQRGMASWHACMASSSAMYVLSSLSFGTLLFLHPYSCALGCPLHTLLLATYSLHS